MEDDQSNISSMVLMLSSEGALSQPKETGFFIERNMKEGNSLQRKHAVCDCVITVEVSSVMIGGWLLYLVVA
ncbi:hypothetical protein CK203_056067 [Vitis vinifera]|uniref:Uncharacterized protein n=1 Tax=Vitis vinifera TaxID=29760 RepID=A0A438G933_VITVI|nr:hypothetical protein CK203_056067 [Vitis vinifera]